MKFGFVLFPLCGAILCFSMAVIMRIREKPSLVQGEKQKDILTLLSEYFDKHLQKYGGTMKESTYFAIALIAFSGVAVLLFITKQTVAIAFFGGFVGLLIPEVILRLANSRKKKQFENRYAQALQQMAASLRSGLTIQQAVADLCKSPFIHDSVKEGFRQIDADITVGLSIKEAFLRAAQISDNEDAMDVALSLALQNELGGNEAKVVETVARNISSRILLRREVKSLFADTNITILTMDVMPLLIIAWLLAGSRQYVDIFFETPFMTAVFVGIVIYTLIGSIVIRRVVRKGTGGM